VLEVSDNGVGIDPEDLPRVFEPMVSTKGGGRGMGLAAVRGIVVGHGATLTVYSEVGRGTTVKVLFPAVQGLSEDDTEPTSDERNGRHTILVADDNAMVRKFARRALEKVGYQVLLAEDGQEAIERFHEAKGKVDVVVVDLTMPRLDGTDTFRQLRLVDPDVRVVLTSGFSEQDVTAGLPSRGLVGFLQKPFTPDQLRQVVADALGLEPSG
jgi:CheY-like chemotaxis protein